MPRLLSILLKWTAVLAVVGVVGIGAVLDAIALLLQFGSGYLPVLIVGTLLVAFMAVFVHESGHVVGGLAAGLRIRRFVVGPVDVFRRKSFHVRLINPPSLLLLGWVEVAPGYTDVPRSRALLFAAGGVLANFGMAMLCLGLAYSLNEPNLPTGPARRASFAHRLLVPHNQAAAWLGIAFLMNLCFSLGNVIPMRGRGLSSDGYQILELLRGGPPAELGRLIGILRSALANSVRPRDWDAVLVERHLSARNGGPGDVMANLYAYYHALDAGEIQRAGALIDQAAAQCAKSPFSRQFVEAAFFEGRHRLDAKRARHWFKKVERGQMEEQTCLRAEAAVLLAEARCVEAAEKVQAALAALPHSADPGGALAEENWLNDLEAEVHRVLSPSRAE
ncbi:MAG TPA: hypothetical protein VGY58_11080 [Gemmataceae bacterium]|nr:hypothetical protein [Gemmataceae bacterium]